MKKIIFSLLICLTLCFSALTAGSLIKANAADEEITIDNVSDLKMDVGASVRIGVAGEESTAENCGIRFSFSLSEASYTALTAKYTDLKYGIFVAPSNYNDETHRIDSESNLSTYYYWKVGEADGKIVYDKTDISGKKRIICLEGNEMKIGGTDGNYRFYGSVVNMLAANVSRDYVGIGYIKYTVDGETHYKFATANNNVRSMEYVARAAYEKEPNHRESLKNLYLQDKGRTVEVLTAPVAVTGLKADGTALELVTAGTADSYSVMQYSLDGETFSAAIPTATEAGEYTVYYKAEPKIDIDTASVVNSVKVTVAEATKEITVNAADINLGVTVADGVATANNAARVSLIGKGVEDIAEVTVTIDGTEYKGSIASNALKFDVPATVYGNKTFTVTGSGETTDYVITVNALFVTKSIATEADLQSISVIAKAIDGEGYYKLTANITLSETWYTSDADNHIIGFDYDFKGTIDGNGKQVIGFNVTHWAATSGFINRFESGELKNIAFVDAVFNSKSGFIMGASKTGAVSLKNVYIGVKTFDSVQDKNMQGNHGLFGPAYDYHDFNMENVIIDYTNAAINVKDGETNGTTFFGFFGGNSKFKNVAVVGIPASYKGTAYEGLGLTNNDGSYKMYISYDNDTDNGVTLPDSDWNRNYWIMSDGSLPTFKGILKKQSITVDDVVADLNVNAEDDVANTTYVATINLGLNLGDTNGKSLTIDGTEYSEWSYGDGVLAIGELPATLYGNKTIVFNVETNTVAYTVTVNALFVTKSIATEADLQSISVIETALGGNGYYRLTDNITMSETGWYATYWDKEKSVEVVTADYTIGLGHDFVGTIDGDGHKIVGFTIRSTNNKTSFVSQLGAGGTIKNIAFIDAAFKQKGSFVSVAANEENAVRLIENVYIGIKTYDTTDQNNHGLFGVDTSGYTMKNVIVDYTAAKITGLDKTKTTKVYLFGNFGWWTTFSNVAVIGVPAEYSDYVCKVNVSKGSVYVAYDDNTTNGVTLPDSGWNETYWTMTAGLLPTFKSKEN